MQYLKYTNIKKKIAIISEFQIFLRSLYLIPQFYLE